MSTYTQSALDQIPRPQDLNPKTSEGRNGRQASSLNKRFLSEGDQGTVTERRLQTALPRPRVSYERCGCRKQKQIMTMSTGMHARGVAAAGVDGAGVCAGDRSDAGLLCRLQYQ
eukprot:8681434-Pyramimonas_sp.AAC.1